MTARDNFDPDMTYWQSLRIVARGLIQWPIYKCEMRWAADAVKEAAGYITLPFARLFALILLPISAPLLAWLVQVDRRRRAKAKSEARERFMNAYRPNANRSEKAAREQGTGREGNV